jgi:hypothetical protein
MALAVIFGDTLSTMVMFLAIILTPSLGFLLFVILSEPLQTIDEDAFMIMSLVDEIIHTIYLAFSSPHLENNTKAFTRVLLLAPLLTTAWLWVYLIVAYVMRAIIGFPSLLKLLSKVMDLENHPVRTVGYVAATVSAMIVGAFSVV